MRRARRCRSRTITGARLLDEAVRRGGFRGKWLFITLTYRLGGDWGPEHVRKLLNRCRSRLERRGLRLHYVWTAELQGRGAIHYHLMLWRPRGCWFPTFDKAGWWPHGSTQIAKARNPVGYMAKYASKIHRGLCDQDGRLLRYPKGARICGAGGLGAERWRFRYWTAPRWARDAIAADHGDGEREIRRIPGGWRDEASGRAYLSPWECAGYTAGGGGLLFVPKERPTS